MLRSPWLRLVLALAPAAPLSAQVSPVRLWSLGGNANLAPSEFLGTTTPDDLVVKTSGVERLRVGATGDIWTHDAFAGMHVLGGRAEVYDYTGADPQFTIDSNGNGGVPTLFLRSGAVGGTGKCEIETNDDLYVQLGGGTPAIVCDWPNAYTGIFTETPTERLTVEGNILCHGMYMGSDERWKRDVEPVFAPLARLLLLRPVTYEYRQDAYPEKDFGAQGRVPGFLAQEVEEVFPELVRTAPDGYKAVNYVGLVPVLVDVVQDQQATIAAQRSELEEQRARVDELAAQVAALRELVGEER